MLAGLIDALQQDLSNMNHPCNLTVFLALVAIGCDSMKSDSAAPIPVAKAVPKELSSTPADGAATSHTIVEPTEKTIGGVKFEIPAGWEEKTLSSSMILGEYGIPGPAGPGRLTLSTAGGGTSANLDRWKGQFRRGVDDPEAKESTIVVAGKEVPMIEVHGAFTDTFGGGGTKSNWQLLGVAIPIDSQHNYFVKLTGPRETLTAKRAEFLKFVQSAQFE